MGHSAVQPAYPGRRATFVDFVPHDRFLDDRWTGVVKLRWKIDPAHPVVIGAGWFQLEKTTRGPEVVAEIMRSGAEGHPVLPGSSIKGSVRQVYELLTPSCGFEHRSCRSRPRDVAPQVCPACSLFGAAGLAGRLAFGEARPEGNDWRQHLRVTQTPAGWGKQRAPQGTMRIYDQKKAVNQDGTSRLAEERTWSVAGDFLSTFRLVNASTRELGLLFASLGFADEKVSPMLRLGGKKYHGLGAVNVEIVEIRQRHPEQLQLTDDEARAFAVRQAMVGLNEDQRLKTWKALHRALSGE